MSKFVVSVLFSVSVLFGPQCNHHLSSEFKENVNRNFPNLFPGTQFWTFRAEI